MTEPRKLFELSKQILDQSAGFANAQKKYNDKFNKIQEPTNFEIEYRKKVFGEKSEPVQVNEDEARQMFWATAMRINPEFVVMDKELLKGVVKYFFGLEGGLDLQKGILICGGVGSGKTQFLKIIQQALLLNGKSFRMFNCIEIEQEIRFGGDYVNYDNGEICFDDLGAEPLESVMFGNRVIPMSEILQRRYNRRENGKTHITSNLTMKEIEARYGSRVCDRLKETCNLVIFGWESLRK